MAQHILVVNDTQDILDSIRMVLEDEGYQISTRTEPTTTVTDVEQLHPDLLILDLLFMGNNIGWELIQVLRLHPATAHLPVIVCTAARKEVTESESVLIGKGVSVLYKPFDIDELVSAVRQSLQAFVTVPPSDGEA